MHSPTPDEQFLLELLNLARLYPANQPELLHSLASTPDVEQSLRYFGVDMAQFQAASSAFAPVAPLAWSPELAQAADQHSADMVYWGQQAHQLPGQPPLPQRVADAGYDNATALGENIYAYAHDVPHGHFGLFIDWGYDGDDRAETGSLLPDWQARGDGMQDPASHRLAMMNPGYTDVGLSATWASPGSAIGPFVITQVFGAKSDSTAQLLGVAYRDGPGDGHYLPGLGQAGVRVAVLGQGDAHFTHTEMAGGYQLPVAPGDYWVAFQGPGLAQPAVQHIQMGAENQKLDLVGAQPLLHAPSPTSDGWAVLGGEGADFLQGSAGPDLFFGGHGDDSLMGEAGIDYALFGTNRPGVAAYALGPTNALQLQGPDGTDRLDQIEVLVFDDGTVMNGLSMALALQPGPDGQLALQAGALGDGPLLNDATVQGAQALQPFSQPQGAGLQLLGGYATHGQVTVTDDGQMAYLPPADFFGTDTVMVLFQDALGQQALDTLEITVTPYAEPQQDAPDSWHDSLPILPVAPHDTLPPPDAENDANSPDAGLGLLLDLGIGGSLLMLMALLV